MQLLIIAGVILVATMLTGTAPAGEYHSGATLICSDCHTMHFSMQHGWDGGSVGTTPAQGGSWVGSTGPNAFLLKAPANELCLACHNGQTFAPDVLGANSNPSYVREAGALTDATPYDSWKGHTLNSTATPPGYNPAVIGATDWYKGNKPGYTGLFCISCHAQHGPATSYRNLGNYQMGSVADAARPSYILNGTDATKDVTITAAGYASGSGSAATFGPYYDQAAIALGRNDTTVGSHKSSNKLDVFCAACHGDFHGGPGDTNIGASPSALDGFIRHPNAQTTIGASGAQGYGGHSNLTRFVGGGAYGPHPNKVKVAADDQVTYADASPTCVSCHKAHGNQNPFGLTFMSRNTGTISEEGTAPAPANTNEGQRNLCGQCHGQGA